MKKYIVIYHVPDELRAKSANRTPEEMKEAMEPWMVWLINVANNWLIWELH